MSYSKIIHLDAGRKYFSPESIKAIIDISAESGYNQMDLYLSDNQGFRFGLDDLVVTTPSGNTYDLTPALGDGFAKGNCAPDGSNKYLTQAEMDDIIAYAQTKGIDIIGSIDAPGHMGAVLMHFPQLCYEGSKSSINLEDKEAVDFALAITEKYVAYFASRGCKYYNIGADEFANDLPSMGFDGLYNKGDYQLFVDFINAAADIVLKYGMIPRTYNDGIYYKSDASFNINKAIEVCHWSAGWWGYYLAPAKFILEQGHKVINTHGDYYWILGGYKCSPEKAAGFVDTSFSGGEAPKADGSMFCIWCDMANEDGPDGGVAVVKNSEEVIRAFGKAIADK